MNSDQSTFNNDSPIYEPNVQIPNTGSKRMQYPMARPARLLSGYCVFVVILFLLFFCMKSISTDAGESFDWEPDQYPNLISNREAKFCTGPNRNPPSAICDPETLLNKSEAHKLDQLIEKVSNSTACLCPPCPPNKNGIVIKVALVSMIKRNKNVTQDENIRHFAERVRTNWNYDLACQHDVLIFYCMTFKRLYISMGAKAERVIDESEANRMISQTQKQFDYGNLYQGLESVISSLKSRAQAYDPRFDVLSLKHGMWITIGAALGSLLVIVVLVWVCIRREAGKRTIGNNNRTNNRKLASGNGSQSKVSMTEQSTDQRYHPVPASDNL